jgi:hypothetical protein
MRLVRKKQRENRTEVEDTGVIAAEAPTERDAEIAVMNVAETTSEDIGDIRMIETGIIQGTMIETVITMATGTGLVIEITVGDDPAPGFETKMIAERNHDPVESNVTTHQLSVAVKLNVAETEMTASGDVNLMTYMISIVPNTPNTLMPAWSKFGPASRFPPISDIIIPPSDYATNGIIICMLEKRLGAKPTR